MASYLGDYAGYFPGHNGMHVSKLPAGYTYPGSGYPYDPFSPSTCLYKDPRTDEEVWGNRVDSGVPAYPTWIGGYMTGTTFQRAIFYCQKEGAAGPSDWTAGKLNNSPINTGYLLTGGYLGNALAFTCPSYQPRKRAGTSSDYRIYYDCHHEGYPQICMPYMWKAMGGYDAKTFTHGDYSVFPVVSKDIREVWSHFNYRNAACTQDITRDSYANPQPAGLATTFLYTKPHIQVFPGNPQFRTSKMLAGRALLSDSFSRCTSQGGWTKYGAVCSDGARCHLEGYNVLYGDSHLAWYGDPQQRIVYWRTNPNMSQGLSVKGKDLALSYIYPGSVTNSKMGPFGVWHQFDVAAGIDVDVDYPSNQ